MNDRGLIETALKRDRVIVTAALSVVIGASWIYVVNGAGMGMSAFDMSSWSRALGQSGPGRMDMTAPTDMGALPMSEGPVPGDLSAAAAMATAMTTPAAWTSGYAVLLFFMWWIMMIAMMLPGAAPAILTYAAIDRRSGARAGRPGGPWPTAAFTFGYLLAWAGFSAVATLLQWLFVQSGVLSPMTMNSTSAFFAGTVLLFTGVYQLTPIKQACLEHCRGPLAFLLLGWRPGAGGALAMGIVHGANCLGCCWGLMAILFFGGIMNLYWIVGLAAIVLAEKVLPIGPRLGAVAGRIFIVWSVTFFVEALA